MSDSTSYAPDSGTAPDPRLDLIEQYESGGRNVPNYRYDSGHTASGYYQITNTLWNEIAPNAGIDTGKYPTAMSAPRDVQTDAAKAIYNKYGYNPWKVNNRLMTALGGPGSAAGTAADVDAMQSGINLARANPLGPAVAGTGGTFAGLTLSGPTTNPLLNQVVQSAANPPTAGSDLSKMMGLALLRGMTPGTHSLVPVNHDPFMMPQVKPPEYSPKPAVFHKVSMGRSEGGSVPNLVSPGNRVDAQGLIERVLGNTGRVSERGPVRAQDE